MLFKSKIANGELSKSYLQISYCDKKLNTLDIKNAGSRVLHKLEKFDASYLNIKLPKPK